MEKQTSTPSNRFVAAEWLVSEVRNRGITRLTITCRSSIVNNSIICSWNCRSIRSKPRKNHGYVWYGGSQGVVPHIRTVDIVSDTAQPSGRRTRVREFGSNSEPTADSRTPHQKRQRREIRGLLEGVGQLKSIPRRGIRIEWSVIGVRTQGIAAVCVAGHVPSSTASRTPRGFSSPASPPPDFV